MKIKGLKKLSTRTQEIKKNGGYIKVAYNPKDNSVKGYWCYFKDTTVPDVETILTLACPMTMQELEWAINCKLTQNR